MKYLVDTSVWIDFFNGKDTSLTELIEKDLVYTHPKILGELACGNLKNRKEIISNLKLFPSAHTATDDECLALIEKEKLFGKGLSFIDVHLIASTRLTGCTLLTSDKLLKRLT